MSFELRVISKFNISVACRIECFQLRFGGYLISTLLPVVQKVCASEKILKIC